MSAVAREQPEAWNEPETTACLALADGTLITGTGIGATGRAVGEICFNTSITGYEEVLTDPSYAGQIVTFTFPHIGNVGTNEDDVETVDMQGTVGVRGCVLKADITEPANWRATRHLDRWLKARNIIGICGVDTRALTNLIRENGMPNAVIANDPQGDFDTAALHAEAANWSGLEGADLAATVTADERYGWTETPWDLAAGYGEQSSASCNIVAIDFGMKRNILRLLADRDCQITVLPANATGNEILGLNPDGVFLSNGPGDPAATGEYSVPAIRQVINAGVPIFGICLGHQMLGLALGGSTKKMHQGHHGANHPVMDHTTGKVEITSMNHGFAIDADSLPDDVEQTHISLFDGSNCGLRVRDKPIFSVQYHPEASPGPQDSHYLFDRFVDMVRRNKAAQL